jgi:hypothetical protein
LGIQQAPGRKFYIGVPLLSVTLPSALSWVLCRPKGEEILMVGVTLFSRGTGALTMSIFVQKLEDILENGGLQQVEERVKLAILQIE